MYSTFFPPVRNIIGFLALFWRVFPWLKSHSVWLFTHSNTFWSLYHNGISWLKSLSHSAFWKIFTVLFNITNYTLNSDQVFGLDLNLHLASAYTPVVATDFLWKRNGIQVTVFRSRNLKVSIMFAALFVLSSGEDAKVWEMHLPGWCHPESLGLGCDVPPHVAT